MPENNQPNHKKNEKNSRPLSAGKVYGNIAAHTDLIVKILCVFAAFCLWIYVMQVESPEYEQTFSHIVVDLVNTEQLVSEKGLAIYNGYGTMIDVTLSGKKSVVSKLTEKDIVATADASAIQEGGSRYDCRIRIDVPAGCKLVGMSQETISVYLDEASQIAVDLSEIRENTSLPANCYTGVVEFPVDKVTVTGPANVLKNIDKAVVALDLTGVTGTVTLTRRVVLLDTAGEVCESPYIEYYPREVDVTVPVYKRAIVPVDVRFRYGYLNENNTVVTVSPQTVEVIGDPSVIDAGDLLAPIVLDEKLDFQGGVYDKTVLLDVADGVTARTTEVQVNVTVNDSMKTRQLTVPGQNIEDTGGKEGVHYTWDKSPVSVTICGSLENIARIMPEDITLRLDMSPYSETNTGTIKVRAEVLIDSAYNEGVFEIGIYEIEVTFEN
ncbi:MAG: YbbR-like domain-containing protein [Eubacteriales bacterium]